MAYILGLGLRPENASFGLGHCGVCLGLEGLGFGLIHSLSILNLDLQCLRCSQGLVLVFALFDSVKLLLSVIFRCYFLDLIH